MRFLRGVHRLEPNRKGTGQVRGRRGRSALRARFQFLSVRGVAFSPPDCRKPIAFHELEELLAPLVAKRLTDQGAEGVHVLTQPLVLDGKLNALPIHSARLFAKWRNYYELVGADRYISRRSG